MNTKIHQIPNATAQRLPIYYRSLKKLNESGVERVKSKELSQMTQIPSATIRRDFSHFGELGRSGYGYEVTYVTEVFRELLNVNNIINVVLVGAGNLGKAILRNNLKKEKNITIKGAFDIESSYFGKEISGVPILPMEQMKNFIIKEQIRTAICAVPSEVSQKVVEQLIDAGITSILNFAPGRIRVPDNIQMKYIDFSSEIFTMVYQNEALYPASLGEEE
ncbi:redox-sensing transcriptional repressor Rex [Carnobacterium inhibens]|uniref:redox-sensing transcriptional repressor Rex n=1 Tax=Carnobacterium inhibens TaxID=147709 RepID=UPI0005583D36|nr:redox-sensing transcriptional repressor Rex [Carnobacterium inhibens]